MASGHSTVTPSCNRLLEKKWDERKLQQHREKLRVTKPTIDTHAPKEFVHLREKLRKQKVEEDRQSTIDKHNRELLTRMHHIMTTTGRVEHRNTDWRPKKSLNFIKRQREAERMTRENQALLNRLMTVKPQYDVRTWESDYVTHMSRARSISVFPPLPTIKHATSPKRIAAEESSSVRLPSIDQIHSPVAEHNHEIDVES
ncbi:hypothetical protein EMCRGX_G028460 [Ephydatia muelleri]|eukprot:Em0020g187a